MVDPLILSNDILQTAVFFLIPAGLWLFLYLLAWEREEFAKPLGFGRGTFWLLLPGSFLGSIANLPFFPWNGDVLAINIGGGLIPVILATALLLRTLELPRRPVIGMLGLFAGESAALLGIVEFVRGPALDLPFVLLMGAVPSGLLVLYGLPRSFPDRTLHVRLGLFLGLTSAITVLTFLTTSSVQGVGIVSAFPEYLLAPIGVGLVAALVMRPGFGWPAERSLPTAYAASTFGVLIGADLLRQPPLYQAGSPTIFAIGGAGLLDLLYLSGLLAVIAAFAGYRLMRGSPGPRPSSTPTVAEPPIVQLRLSWRRGAEGRNPESLALSTSAARTAAAQAQLLVGAESTSPDRPWAGLAVPPWVESDQRNLDSLASTQTADGREALRAWQTGRWLVRIGLELGRPRFASWGQRTWAFAIDLVIVTLPAALGIALLVARTPGTPAHILSGVPLNTAALGFTTYAFSYFALSEALLGHTVGKRLLRLSVYKRGLHSVGGVSAMVRNLPKLVPLTAIGIGTALLVLLAVKGAPLSLAIAPSSSPIGAAGLAAALFGFFVVLVVALAGVVSVFVITHSIESQRFGDYLAGTWVVRDTSSGGPVAPPPGAATGRYG